MAEKKQFVIKNLHKKFNNNVVLDGIDLTIHEGDVLGIIGPSGTGKSTLLRCINQLEVPEAGSIEIDEKEIDLSNSKKSNQKNVTELRQKTGMVFQRFNLFQKKTALENVMEGLITVQKKSKEEARQIALKELERVGMTAWANHYPKHLSGGQQQRVAIARVLAMKPHLILMDEPTSALDPELVGEVLETIKQLAEEGHTMILVSHEMAFIRKVATRCIFLDGGKIVEDGSPKEVFTHPKQERTQDFLRKMSLLEEPEYVI
ncbi:MAG: amino acid ABC transporter ATP-binding protein [Lachnospiraceae bacterium]|nr:amino acid ABC transporter ATP-binding protein [Lachnospiraceae bacterium]